MNILVRLQGGAEERRAAAGKRSLSLQAGRRVPVGAETELCVSRETLETRPLSEVFDFEKVGVNTLVRI